MARARQNFPKLLELAAREPQAVYRRDTLVATVVSPDLAAKAQEAQAAEGRMTLADDLDELRRLCVEENYFLEPPQRVDRVVTPSRPAPRRRTRPKGPTR